MHKKPADFLSVLLYYGFEFGKLQLSTWKEFFSGKWLSHLKPVSSNNCFFPKQTPLVEPLTVPSLVASVPSTPQVNKNDEENEKLFQQTRDRWLELPRELEERIDYNEKSKVVHFDKQPTFQPDVFDLEDLERFHQEPHPDFFGYKLPTRLGSAPKLTSLLGKRTKPSSL